MRHEQVTEWAEESEDSRLRLSETAYRWERGRPARHERVSAKN
ncbi:MAG: hypothetical protein ACR2LZ_09770 [Pyrinomonadaceae bacterium]